MCGIFGIYSKSSNVSNTELLFKSLKSLQHRGKDGYGICFLNKKNDITFFRNKGLIPTKIPLIQTAKKISITILSKSLLKLELISFVLE